MVEGSDIGFIVLAMLLANLGMFICIPFLFLRKTRLWFSTLSKPIGSPPIWVFVWLWIVCYSALGYGTYFVWNKKQKLTNLVAECIGYALLLVATFVWIFLLVVLRLLKYGYFTSCVVMFLSAFNCVGFFFADLSAGFSSLPSLVLNCLIRMYNRQLYIMNDEDALW